MNQFPVANESLQDCGPFDGLQFVERQIARVHALEHSNLAATGDHLVTKSDAMSTLKRARFFAISLRTLLIEASHEERAFEKAGTIKGLERGGIECTGAARG